MRGMWIPGKEREGDAVAYNTLTQESAVDKRTIRILNAREEARGIHGTYLLRRIHDYGIFITVDGLLFAINPKGDGNHEKVTRQMLKCWLRHDYLHKAGDFSVFKFDKEALTLKGAKLSRVIDLAIEAAMRFAKDLGEGKIEGRKSQYLSEVSCGK